MKIAPFIRAIEKYNCQLSTVFNLLARLNPEASGEAGPASIPHFQHPRLKASPESEGQKSEDQSGRGFGAKRRILTERSECQGRGKKLITV